MSTACVSRLVEANADNREPDLAGQAGDFGLLAAAGHAAGRDARDHRMAP